jgi:hypothetical protein
VIIKGIAVNEIIQLGLYRLYLPMSLDAVTMLPSAPCQRVLRLAPRSRPRGYFHAKTMPDIVEASSGIRMWDADTKVLIAGTYSKVR